MKNLILIQHTEAVHHTNSMVGSWTDWPLTDRGKEHAENIGRKLSEELKGKAGGVSFLGEGSDKRRMMYRFNDLSYIR